MTDLVSAETQATLAEWVTVQMRPWRGHHLPPAALTEGLRALNQALDHVFLFEFAAGTVRLLPTPHHTAAELEQASAGHAYRARCYRDFFRLVTQHRPIRPGLVGMSMHDTPLNPCTLPLLAFQKPKGTRPILLPDIDALRHDFYTGQPLNDVPFKHKQTTAVFAGSTTGEMHSVESIAARTNPRLRSCLFFRDHATVDFTLPNIVQCVTTAAEAALRALQLGSVPTPWPEQLRHKFIISMDGNGATCSRVALALRSRSVLLKYNSSHELYYFTGLIPGRHYVPIANDEDVLATIHEEQNHPGRFQPLAHESRRFFREYLTLAPSLSYTAKLLNRYMHLFGFAGLDR